MHPHYLLEQRRRPEHLLLQQDEEYHWLILDLLLVDLPKLCDVSLQAATGVQDLLGYSQLGLVEFLDSILSFSKRSLLAWWTFVDMHSLRC